jgi:hypothetical protein
MIFVDSSYFIALANRGDKWHADAVRIKDEIKDETMVISDFVVAETVGIIGRHFGGKTAHKLYQFLVTRCKVVFTDYIILDAAIEKYFLKFNGSVSVADCVAVDIMEKYGVSAIVSFDSDFDKVKWIQRIK